MNAKPEETPLSLSHFSLLCCFSQTCGWSPLRELGRMFRLDEWQEILKPFVARWFNCVPFWLETHPLTLLTIPWTSLVIASAWKVRESGNIRWSWGVSLAIVLQYLTDLFDGAVGHTRNTGLVKCGFYMDHFLDYVFQCGLIIGYAIIAPPQQNLVF
jgi:phosphatidylglycerophosphate synthase